MWQDRTSTRFVQLGRRTRTVPRLGLSIFGDGDRIAIWDLETLVFSSMLLLVVVFSSVCAPLFVFGVFLCPNFLYYDLAALLAEIVVYRFPIFSSTSSIFFSEFFLAEFGGVEIFLFAFSVCCFRGFELL
jgi:hypothetical protein